MGRLIQTLKSIIMVMIDDFIKIQIRWDDSGHKYLIPNELNEDFTRVTDLGEDGEIEFENKFSKYRQGGMLPQLYVLRTDINQ